MLHWMVETYLFWTSIVQDYNDETSVLFVSKRNLFDFGPTDFNNSSKLPLIIKHWEESIATLKGLPYQW